MWQLYAQTAMDLVRERQLEARRNGHHAHLGSGPTVGHRVRRVIGGALASLGRLTERVGTATVELGSRVEGPIANT